MSTEIVMEAERFGRTGPNFVHRLTGPFMSDQLAYCIDAPEHIARGALCSTLHEPCDRLRSVGMKPYHYISATVQR